MLGSSWCKLYFLNIFEVSCCLCCSRTETSVSFLLAKRCHTSSSVCTSWDEEHSKQLAISFAVAITALCPNPVQCVGGVATNFLYRNTYLIHSKSRYSCPSSWVFHTHPPVFWLAQLRPPLSAAYLILLDKHPVFFFFFFSQRPVLIKYRLWNIYASLPKASQTGGERGRVETNTCAAAWPT